MVSWFANRKGRRASAKLSRNNELPKEARRELASLASLHRERQTRVVVATACSFGLSSWLTAKGIFDKAVEAGVATPEGMVTGAMSAGVSSALLAVSTMTFFGVAASAARRQRWHVAVLGFSLLPFMVGISTVNAVIGNAGPPSLVYDMRDNAAAHVHAYERGAMDASSARSAAVALTPLQSSICDLADREGQTGVLSGSAGRGGVQAAYVSSCTSVRAIIETLDNTVTRNEERSSEAARILTELVAIPGNTDLSVFERQAVFRVEVGALRKLLEEFGTENVADRLQAQLDILQASVATLGVKDSAFGKKQAEAIGNLKNSLGFVATIIRDLLVSEETAAVSPPAALRDMGAAVIAYWHRNIPQILIAVLSDVMMVWFTGLLLVSKDTLEGHRRRLTSRPRNRR